MANPENGVRMENLESREGYLLFLGSALLLVGILHVTLSLIMFATVGFDTSRWVVEHLSTAEGAEPTIRGFAGLVGFYITAMNWTGWLSGAFSIYAARQVMNGRGYRSALVAAVLNLFYLPMGLTIGIVTLIGLRRPSVREAFDESLVAKA